MAEVVWDTERNTSNASTFCPLVLQPSKMIKCIMASLALNSKLQLCWHHLSTTRERTGFSRQSWIGQEIWILFLTLSQTCCVTLSKSLHLSLSVSFHHLSVLSIFFIVQTLQGRISLIISLYNAQRYAWLLFKMSYMCMSYNKDLTLLETTVIN